MTLNARALIAGLIDRVDGVDLEIRLSIIRHYTRGDLVAAKEAIDHLSAEGAAIVLKDVEEAKDDDVCLVMLKFPQGIVGDASWAKWFNRSLAQSKFISPETLAANLVQKEKEPNQPPEPTR